MAFSKGQKSGHKNHHGHKNRYHKNRYHIYRHGLYKQASVNNSHIFLHSHEGNEGLDEFKSVVLKLDYSCLENTPVEKLSNMDLVANSRPNFLISEHTWLSEIRENAFTDNYCNYPSEVYFCEDKVWHLNGHFKRIDEYRKAFHSLWTV